MVLTLPCSPATTPAHACACACALARTYGIRALEVELRGESRLLEKLSSLPRGNDRSQGRAYKTMFTSPPPPTVSRIERRSSISRITLHFSLQRYPLADLSFLLLLPLPLPLDDSRSKTCSAIDTKSLERRERSVCPLPPSPPLPSPTRSMPILEERRGTERNLVRKRGRVDTCALRTEAEEVCLNGNAQRVGGGGEEEEEGRGISHGTSHHCEMVAL